MKYSQVRSLTGHCREVRYRMDLVNSGQVEFQVAKTAVNSPGDFDLKMNILSGSGSGI